MNRTQNTSHADGKTRRTAGFSPLLVALMLGIFNAGAYGADGAGKPKRRYRPTRAQLRLAEQNRRTAARIMELRRRRELEQKHGPAQSRRAEPGPSLEQRRLPHPDSRRQPAPGTAATRNGSAPGLSAAIREPDRWLASVPVIRCRSRRLIPASAIARRYRMRISPEDNGITMRNSRFCVTLHPDKRNASINRTAVYLTTAPRRLGPELCVDEQDFLLVLDPLLRKGAQRRNPVRTILIDPGHGGRDRGAAGPGNILEKNITLLLAGKVARTLQKQGYRVFLTRISDCYLTLRQRTDMAKNLHADLFVSIHCNAVNNQAIRGIETFALTPGGAASASGKQRTRAAGSGNAFDPENYRLAYEVQRNLLRATGAKDRGVKHANLFVLRNAHCPAVLIETGFVTHPGEGLLLAKSAYQDRLARGIVSGIAAYARAVR